jgi:hypothetical protein
MRNRLSEENTMATTVRVEDDVHRSLREIAERERRPIGKVIEEAVRLYEKEQFWNEVNASLERLREHPVAWQDYVDELADWDAMPNDALAAEPPYYTSEEEEFLAASDRSESR